MPVEPWVLAGLGAASFAGSYATAAFGIGGGAFLLAVMATLLPGGALIPVHGLVQLGSNAGRLAILSGHVLWTALPGFALGSALGCGLGGLVAVELPPAAVEIGVGLFVIWSVAARPPGWLRTWPSATGVVSSFLTMFFGATGLFVASFVKSLELPRQGHVATHAALMTLQHALKVMVFGILGFAFGAWAGVVAVMVAAGFAGTVAGKATLVRMNDRLFRLALDVLLVLISVRLIHAGAAELLWR